MVIAHPEMKSINIILIKHPIEWHQDKRSEAEAEALIDERYRLITILHDYPPKTAMSLIFTKHKSLELQ